MNVIQTFLNNIPSSGNIKDIPFSPRKFIKIPRSEPITKPKFTTTFDLEYRRVMQQVYYYREPIRYFKNFMLHPKNFDQKKYKS